MSLKAKPKITLTVSHTGEYVAKLHYETPYIVYPINNSTEEHLKLGIEQIKMLLIKQIIDAKVDFT